MLRPKALTQAPEQRGLPAGLLGLRRHRRQGHRRHRQQHLGGLRQERAPGLQRGQPQVHPDGLHGGTSGHHARGQPPAVHVREGDGGIWDAESQGAGAGPVPGGAADTGGRILTPGAGS
ncbi:ragulator complex protein LAMTOR2 isoform X2 [Cygnus olor]|uniref:ragulator complex protein LAMTOR2 isoform X2 n=1 Tax=Cygnus olor TaxID=8869 RepID=UPI001ADE5889|nr:ragulator complex protein LAMTOR2 isoform X2 [Cygnus olor]